MESLSADLRDELAANDERKVTDPRDIPLRFSSMKLIDQSPLHYLHACQRGYEETLSMRIGSGAHAILFSQPYAVYVGKTRAGKAWEEFKTAHAGQLILSQTELAKSQAMADAIRANPTAVRLMFGGAKLEQRIDWEWQGRKFRSTPDVAASTHLVDLKCLRSANPEDVKWQSSKMAYHVQAALYRRALHSLGKNHRIQDCYLIVVENKAPHPVTVLRFTESALEAGDRTSQGWLEQVLAAEASGIYHGYAQSVVDLSLPMSESDLVWGDDDDDSDDE